MPLTTIAFGLILLVAGLGTYAAADDPAFVALLPAFLGLVALACGVAAVIKKDLRMHLMHLAVLLALVGVVVPLWLFVQFLIDLGGDDGLRLLRIFMTAAVSGLYLYAAVQSFLAARRKRKNEQAPGTPEPPEQGTPTPDTPGMSGEANP